MGRKPPTGETQEQYRQRIITEICELMSNGKTLSGLCNEENNIFPPKSTLMNWLRESEEFANQYARAKELQADHFAEEIVDIADTEKDAAIARNRIDARKWHASKVAPKKYGDKIEQTHTGEISVISKIERTVVKPQ